ncbi:MULTISPECIES: methyl-accepting chemotaxis protein [unclassified Paenibacillus]|uniref:methyl-accepting chemotaxis protein n=1 Tax=unclassified Paenibacillus TaxID=185978 RepID=UPI0012FD7DFB|nr:MULTISPECIES: methyl-accepting chemotaxis protein [unclassified Paenibacillus]ASS68535.2 hypothetical protein CIC07_22165 [Paenibacillus sp. RUD330]
MNNPFTAGRPLALAFAGSAALIGAASGIVHFAVLSLAGASGRSAAWGGMLTFVLVLAGAAALAALLPKIRRRFGLEPAAGEAEAAAPAQEQEQSPSTERILSLAKEAAVASGSLVRDNEFCKDLVEGITASIEQISLGNESIAVESRNNMAMLEEVTKGMEHIADSSMSLAEETAVVAETADQGAAVIDNAVSQMNIVSEHAAASSEALSGMSGLNEEIEKIAHVVSQISSQINLLSLNAAIEAAHAGEFGRGFSVVASEIRQLAEQSSSSARDIAKTAADIRSYFRRSSEAMTRFNVELQSGVSSVNSAGQAFHEIVGLTGSVSEKVQEISSVTQQINASTEEILTSVRGTSESTEVALAGSKEIAMCAEEQLDAMTQSLDSARLLRQQVLAIQEEASRHEADHEENR